MANTTDRWEYREVFGGAQCNTLDDLNRLGADGWELVAVRNSGTKNQTYTFKRRLRRHDMIAAAVRNHLQGVVLVDENDCPGHVASAADPKVCGRCGIHIDSLRPDEDD